MSFVCYGAVLKHTPHHTFPLYPMCYEYFECRVGSQTLVYPGEFGDKAEMRALLGLFCFRKTYPKTANYGKIAVSSKRHSKEQTANQAKASQRLACKRNSYLFYGGCIFIAHSQKKEETNRYGNGSSGYAFAGRRA